MFPIARKKPNLGKGLVSGIVAGIVASFVMNRFQELRERLLQLREQEKTDREGQSPQTRKAADGGGENATVRTAEKISEGVFDRPLREEEKKLAGPAVHYAFGTAVGALYGAIADVWPEATAAAGMPFGAAVWLGADEVTSGPEALEKAERLSPVDARLRPGLARRLRGDDRARAEGGPKGALSGPRG